MTKGFLSRSPRSLWILRPVQPFAPNRVSGLLIIYVKHPQRHLRSLFNLRSKDAHPCTEGSRTLLRWCFHTRRNVHYLAPWRMQSFPGSIPTLRDDVPHHSDGACGGFRGRLVNVRGNVPLPSTGPEPLRLARLGLSSVCSGGLNRGPQEGDPEMASVC